MIAQMMPSSRRKPAACPIMDVVLRAQAFRAQVLPATNHGAVARRLIASIQARECTPDGGFSRVPD
jgi:hypothetical protein